MPQSGTDQLTRASSVVSRFAEHKRICDSDIHSRCTNTITAFKNTQEKHRSQLYATTRSLITAWQRYTTAQIEKNRDQGHLFNPLFFFDICETKHSHLLGYLLKPWEKHGQGNTFLVSFLKLLGVPYPEKGKWQVTIEQGRIDILLKRTTPPSVVIIENKSNDATDQPHQLYRYWHKAIHPMVGRQSYQSRKIQENFQIVYLPSGEHKVPEEHSTRRPDYIPLGSAGGHDHLPLDYTLLNFNNDIADWLTTVTHQIAPNNNRLKSYLEFYTELCRSL